MNMLLLAAGLGAGAFALLHRPTLAHISNAVIVSGGRNELPPDHQLQDLRGADGTNLGLLGRISANVTVGNVPAGSTLQLVGLTAGVPYGVSAAVPVQAGQVVPMTLDYWWNWGVGPVAIVARINRPTGGAVDTTPVVVGAITQRLPV